MLEDVATLMVCPFTSWIRMVTGQMLKPLPRKPATTALLALLEAGSGHESKLVVWLDKTKLLYKSRIANIHGPVESRIILGKALGKSSSLRRVRLVG